MNTKVQKSEKEKLFTVLKILGVILVVSLLMGMLLKNVMFPPYDEPVITGNLTVKTMEFTWEDESQYQKNSKKGRGTGAD